MMAATVARKTALSRAGRNGGRTRWATDPVGARQAAQKGGLLVRQSVERAAAYRLYRRMLAQGQVVKFVGINRSAVAAHYASL